MPLAVRLTRPILAAGRIACVLAGATLAGLPALAQGASPATSPSPASPSTTPAAPAAGAPPAAAPPVTVTPTPAAPGAPASPSATAAPSASEGADATPLVDVPARPAAVTSGRVVWADGYPTLLASFAKLAKALDANGLKPAGKPLAVLVAIADDGFSFQAMVPLESAPAGKDQLAPDVAIGATPAGKAYKFQHRSAYDDLDSTYEAITAFLDEKGVEAKDTIIEEYLTTPKDSDDTGLEVDIYVFPKDAPAASPTTPVAPAPVAPATPAAPKP